MPWPGAPLRIALLLLVATVGPPGALSEENVGCLFSERLCLEDEWCFDDYAFGRCLPATGDVDEDDLFRYNLEREVLHQISRELRRLFALGYRWSHGYTQCRLQAMLYATRHEISFDNNACSHLVDQDLEGALKAYEGQDHLDPREMAIVKYTPSIENPHADFADEVYYPPVDESAAQQAIREKILPSNAVDLYDMEDPYAQYEVMRKRTWIPQMHRRSLPSPQYFTGKYNTPKNFRSGLETRDGMDAYPPPASDLEDNEWEHNTNQADGLSLEDLREMYPLVKYLNDMKLSPEDVENLLSPGTYDKLSKLLEQFEESQDINQDFDVDEYLRQNQDEQDLENDPFERFTLTYNTPDRFRAGWESRDTLQEDFPESRIYSDENEEAGQEYGSGYHNQDEIFRELKNDNNYLSYDHGNSDDDEVFRELRNQQLADKVMMLNGGSPDRGIYTEGGVVYAPETNAAEENLVGESYSNDDLLKSNLDQILLKYNLGFKRRERLDVKKPGPPFDSRKSISTSQEVRDQEHDILPSMVRKSLNLDSTDVGSHADPEYIYVQFKNRIHSWEEGENIIRNLSRLLNMAPGDVSHPRVDSIGVSFKAVPNSRGLSATELTKKIDSVKDDLRAISGVEIASVGIAADNTRQAVRSQEDAILPAMMRKRPVVAHPDPTHDNFDVDTEYIYVQFKDRITSWKEGEYIIGNISKLLKLDPPAVSHGRVDFNEVSFKAVPNSRGLNTTELTRKIDSIKDELKATTGVEITAIGIGDKTKMEAILTKVPNNTNLYIVLFLVCGILVALIIATVLLIQIKKHLKIKEKLEGLSRPDTEASKDYQDLCRARMATKGQQPPGDTVHGRITSLSRESEQSPSSRSSTSSWSEEPALHNMDISTGHMVLSYMEDHLKNKDRLEQEWVALCAYVAEPCETTVALRKENVDKNRYPDIIPYDHARVVLNELSNATGSDYINASSITDHDPRNPAYIATQGPLPHTAPDFWQLIWEQGAVVIVMLTRLTEGGAAMCHRYWPEEGSELYHIYEVHLVSEHIWCDDYLVRSFYLKNVRTGETRTVTQFHFLSWPEAGVPASTKALLEFRRKVNKSYRGRSCPIVVHCSDGAGRTGTYCLIDMVLSRMAKGAKEIDIAATLEHLRDQRPRMVATKQQFEFVLTAVAEEVHAILKALPPQPAAPPAQTEKEKQ